MANLIKVVFEGRINWGVRGLLGSPLIASFHGKGGDGKRQGFRFRDHLDNGLSYIFPNGGYSAQGGEWSDPVKGTGYEEDVEYTDRLFAAIHGFWGTDPTRVYINGFSAGGHLTNLVSVMRADKYAGYGILAALPQTTTFDLAGAQDLLSVPIFTMHGLEDNKSGYASDGGSGRLTPEEMRAWYMHRTSNVGEAWTLTVEHGISPFVARRQTWDNERMELVEVAGLGHAWARQGKHGIDAAGMLLESMGLV